MKKQRMLKVLSVAVISAALTVCTGLYANAAENGNETPVLPVTATDEEQSKLTLGYDALPKEVYAGDMITLSLKASGGDENYTYVFLQKGQNDSDFVEVASNTEGVYEYSFSKPGTYQIRFYAYDASENKSEIVASEVNVKALEELSDNGTNLSAKAVNAGGKLTVKAVFKGGKEPYTYKYEYKKDGGSWGNMVDYSEKSSHTYTVPKTVGKYAVRVTAKDADGNTASKELAFTVINETGKALSLGGKVSATNLAVGSPVTATATISGGTAPYQFRYSYKSGNGSWVYVDKNYVDTKTRKITLPKKVGTYTVRIQVKDYNGKTAEKKFTVNVKSLDVSKSTVNKTTAKIKESVKLTAKTSYKSGTVNYRYSYKKTSASSWTYSGNYAAAGSHNFQFKSAGTYYVRVQAKDSTGKVVTKQFKITVKAMSITAKLSGGTMISTAKSVKLTTKVTNNSGTAKYRYSYSTDNGKTWKYTGNYTTASSKNFKFKSGNIYKIRVSVKDNSGKVLTKQFKVTVYNSKTTTLKAGTTLQKSANWKSKSLSTLKTGTKVNVIKTTGNWYFVKYNNTTGYIYNLAFGKSRNYNSISKSELPTIADDILFSKGKDVLTLYNYVNRMGYVSAKNDSLENLCVYILKYSRGACYHRAALLYYLLDRAGYEVVRVNDGIDNYTGGSPHNWCIIKTSAGWRHIDPTPVIGLGKKYLVKDSAISSYFSWNRKKYPKCV
ncbi:MAG: hypothetical protein IJ192_06375 [Clostridia bacterium]|nr:hypothetical protein [Clostridia bacterium]